jgi:recombination protein RecT
MALTRCARDGLMPDGREAAMVVYSTKNSRTGQYEKKAQYLPMVDGVLKRARQSGQVVNITGKVVHMADKFDYWVDEHGEHIEHRPAFENTGEIRLVYAFAKLTSGEIVVEVMSKADVEKVRDGTAKRDRDGKLKIPSAWQKWFDRMALKTVLHRLARRLPCASEMYSLLDVGAEPERHDGDLPAAKTMPGRPRLRDVLNRRAQQGMAKAESIEEAVTVELEPEPENPEFEALMNALDDVTDTQSYTEVAARCTEFAKTLSEARRAVLRDKVRQAKARIDNADRRSL